ncbi:MAG: hypothetical protein CVV44_02040 [Spirochaetae bacterium HGW-Spirochaetae-1]|nr:MAG: hypothetical protein CVV44_02040 [Spirochaetae bacterium HGW-Spirochaetae-1]
MAGISGRVINVPVSRNLGVRQNPSAGWDVPGGPGQALCRRGASAAPLLHHPRVASNASDILVLTFYGEVFYMNLFEH